jgi:hypothetical protein
VIPSTRTIVVEVPDLVAISTEEQLRDATHYLRAKSNEIRGILNATTDLWIDACIQRRALTGAP